jgi:uncharacterized repeat protein (TIGR03803 family)
MYEEESMKCRKKIWFEGAALLLIAITLLLAPGAGAQSKYKTLHRFKDDAHGKFVYAGLIFDQIGNLYGTTILGGARGNGTVFKLAPNADGSWTKNVLYNFSGREDGGSPYASLIFDQTGNLYGTTADGGTMSLGTVFKLTPNADGSWTETVIYSFLGREDGGSPLAGLILDSAGNLYGTTFYDGDFTTAFELMPNADGSWTEKVLHVFQNGSDGSQSSAGLIFDQAGNLYGTTAYGGGSSSCNLNTCGVVFELTPNQDGTWTENLLYRFTGGKDGGNPFGGLIFDQAGNLYGTTEFGGNCGAVGCGVVFKLTRQADGSWAESVPYSFSGRDGDHPLASLISDADGNLYGTTVGARSGPCVAAYGCGVVFRLTPNSNGTWTESVLHRFSDHPGAHPDASLIFDASGNLYGTTAGDGTITFGSVFEITP